MIGTTLHFIFVLSSSVSMLTIAYVLWSVVKSHATVEIRIEDLDPECFDLKNGKLSVRPDYIQKHLS